MELDGKRGKGRVIYSLARAVIGVNERERSFSGDAFRVNGVAVVLARYIRSSAIKRLYRLINTSVTEFELIRASSGRQRGKLMPEAYSEDRKLSEKFTDLCDLERIIRRIARAV